MSHQDPLVNSGRRSVLKALAGGVLFPSILPASAFGAHAPSRRITVGCIGVGRMGRDDMREFLGMPEVQILAVCDVDSKRAKAAQELVIQSYAARTPSGTYKGCDVIGDFRDLVDREDVDAVMICTPDHWHALPALAAARRGKDIFLQKPLTLTIEEGRVLSDAVSRHQCIFQVGSQQRSDQKFRFACELVRNGRIGRLERIQVGVGIDSPTGLRPVMPVPSNLDYDFWLGPAPWTEYTEDRVHPQNGYGRPGWLRVWDYGAGMVTGWGAHQMDIAHWAMDVERSGPIEIEGGGEYPRDGVWDVHGRFEIRYLYSNGVEVTFADSGKVKDGVTFLGTEGRVHVQRGLLDTEPRSLLKEVLGPDEIHLYESKSHKGNFIECIKTRAQTVAPVEVGHRTCTACLLGDIAMRMGRTLKWNPETERFVGDEGADRWISRPMRSPWAL